MDWIHSTLAHDLLLGFWAAFAVDLQAWMGSTGWVVAGFNWPVATKRWAVGVLSAALLHFGMGLA